MDKRLVRIEWIDAISHEGGAWLSAQFDTLLPSNCMSVGWVLTDTTEHIHIAAHFSNDGKDMGGDICIPKGCIQKVEELNGFS